MYNSVRFIPDNWEFSSKLRCGVWKSTKHVFCVCLMEPTLSSFHFSYMWSTWPPSSLQLLLFKSSMLWLTCTLPFNSSFIPGAVVNLKNKKIHALWKQNTQIKNFVFVWSFRNSLWDLIKCDVWWNLNLWQKNSLGPTSDTNAEKPKKYQPKANYIEKALPEEHYSERPKLLFW